jgi:hypothetical protein
MQQTVLRLYIDSFGKIYEQQLNTRVPLSFPPFYYDNNRDIRPFIFDKNIHMKNGKPWPEWLVQKKIKLEPVLSTLRNWMFTESDNLIDFGPYRPLVVSPFVRHMLHESGGDISGTTSGSGSGNIKRRVLVDVGANGFFASPKYLLDSYEPFQPFTDAIMIEPEEHFKASIPEAYTKKYNIVHLQVYAEVNTGSKTDLLLLLPTLVKKSDFVVLKFDVDPNRYAEGPTMEWGFLFVLLTNPLIADLVDELYIELHFNFPQIFWDHKHSNWEALDAIRSLREKGVIVHSWP